MAGMGMVIAIIGIIARFTGIDLDDKQTTEIANGIMIVFGFVYMVAGQLMREDLKWGIKRKTPLE